MYSGEKYKLRSGNLRCTGRRDNRCKTGITEYTIRGSGFGSPFIGLHLYTWSVLMSAMMIAGVVITLMVEVSIQKTSGKTLIPAWCGRYVCYFFALIIAANVVSTLLECGIGQCDGDTYYYRLLSYHEKLNNGGLSMPENYLADIS